MSSTSILVLLCTVALNAISYGAPLNIFATTYDSQHPEVQFIKYGVAKNLSILSRGHELDPNMIELGIVYSPKQQRVFLISEKSSNGESFVYLRAALPDTMSVTYVVALQFSNGTALRLRLNHLAVDDKRGAILATFTWPENSDAASYIVSVNYFSGTADIIYNFPKGFYSMGGLDLDADRDICYMHMTSDPYSRDDDYIIGLDLATLKIVSNFTIYSGYDGPFRGQIRFVPKLNKFVGLGFVSSPAGYYFSTLNVFDIQKGKLTCTFLNYSAITKFVVLVVPTTAALDPVNSLFYVQVIDASNDVHGYNYYLLQFDLNDGACPRGRMLGRVLSYGQLGLQTFTTIG